MKKMIVAAIMAVFAMNAMAQNDYIKRNRPYSTNSIIYDESKKETSEIKNSDKSWYRYDDLQNGMWFFGVGAGAHYYIGDHNRQAKLKDALGATFDVYGGYWFNTTSGLRLSLHGYNTHGVTRNEGLGNPYKYGNYDYVGNNGALQFRQKFNFYSVNVDYMLNLTQLFCKDGVVRRYNAIPYIGVAYCHMLSEGDGEGTVLKNYSWGISGGLLNTYKLSRLFDLTLDIHANTVSEEFDSDTGKRVGEGTIGASLGLNVHL